MESQFTNSGMPMINRFNNKDGGYNTNEYAYDDIPAVMRNKQKITVNLEDAVLEEQKLYQILEVSWQ